MHTYIYIITHVCISYSNESYFSIRFESESDSSRVVLKLYRAFLNDYNYLIQCVAIHYIINRIYFKF